MSDTTKCKSCQYWRSVWGNSPAVCHHLLDTGKRRVEVGGVCKSIIRKRKKGSSE